VVKVNFSKETLRRLQQQLGTTCYDFLGFTVDLDAATLTDDVYDNHWEELMVRLIPALLSHYSVGNPVALTGKLVKFKDIPGG
jgi:hypothetical protein